MLTQHNQEFQPYIIPDLLLQRRKEGRGLGMRLESREIT